MFLKEYTVRGVVVVLDYTRLTVVEPVPEVGKAMLDEVFGGSEVEPRVDCSNG
jgi:hypothetical protein